MNNNNPITELVSIKVEAHAWGFDSQERRTSAKETAKMVTLGDGGRIYKEEVGQIKRTYSSDSVCSICRFARCRPEDVEATKKAIMDEINFVIVELQKELDMLKANLPASLPSPANLGLFATGVAS